VAEPEEVELPLAGRTVDRVDVSRWVPKLRLEFWRFGDASPGPDYYHLIIDGPFRLTSSDDSVEVDPAAGPDPTYLRLVDKTVGRAIAFRDGSLRVAFTDGELLTVEPSRYEPWQLEAEGGGGVEMVSVAGGGLAVSFRPAD
jgi:hypothetical protein